MSDQAEVAEVFSALVYEDDNTMNIVIFPMKNSEVKQTGLQLES